MIQKKEILEFFLKEKVIDAEDPTLVKFLFRIKKNPNQNQENHEKILEQY